MLEEFKEIEEIINQIDDINLEEWNKKENETQEELEERIQGIEEEIEEELIDAISDSLLDEHEINEEEAIKEAREKIQKEYEIYQEAFDIDNNGKLILKNNEELSRLGYNTNEEIEKLNSVANNYNNPNLYIESIRKSIKEVKDIDTEIDRKLEIAKIYISAKIRGEEPVISSNVIKTQKYEDNNKYIGTTKQLSRVPIVQNEFVYNSGLISRSYIRYMPDLPKISNNTQLSNNTMATSNVMPRQRTKVANPTKLQVLRNMEKKIDKSNELTKQKIKARTELKMAFKEFEGKELNEAENNSLKQRIAKIEKKYPNTVNEKILSRLYESFKIKKPNEQSNVLDSELETIELKEEEQQEPLINPPVNNGTKHQNNLLGKRQKRKIRSPKLEKLVIGATLGTLKSKGKQKLTDLIGSAKKIRTKANDSRRQLRQSVIEKENDKNINKENNQKEKTEPSKQVSRDEIKDVINKSLRMSDIIKYQKGAIIPIINHTVNYLKENDDENVQKFLDKTLKQIENIPAINLLNQKYNVLIFDYISSLYKDGISTEGREIIPKDDNKKYYYTYILNRKIGENISENIQLNQQRLEKIKEYYDENSEKIERGYLEILRKQNLKKKASLYEKLKSSKEYSKAIQDLNLSTENDYIRLLTIKEDLKNGVYRRTIGSFTNKMEYERLFDTIIKRFNNGEQFSKKALEDLGDICYEGISDNFENRVIEPKIDLAKRLYSKITNIEENKKVYGRLLNIRKLELNPIADKKKIRQIDKIIKEKGLRRDSEIVIRDKATINQYVCSDLHGQYEIYEKIVNSIGKNDKLYILGDAIDRGPDGIKILQDIARRQEKGQVEFFMGNHEYMMLQSLFLGNKQVEKVWTSDSNEGKKTKEDFDKLSVEEKGKIKDLLLNALVYKEVNTGDEKIHLVHAKAIQDSNKKEERVKDLLNTERQEDLETAVWTRKGDKKSSENDEVWKDEEIGKDNEFTIIGHTPTSGTIDLAKGYVNIDCGSSYFGNECLLRINDGKVMYVDNFEGCKQQMKDEHEEIR